MVLEGVLNFRSRAPVQRSKMAIHAIRAVAAQPNDGAAGDVGAFRSADWSSAAMLSCSSDYRQFVEGGLP